MYVPLEENTVAFNDSMVMASSFLCHFVYSATSGTSNTPRFPHEKEGKKELNCGHAAPEGRGNQERGLLVREVGRQHWEERGSSGGRGHGDVGGKGAERRATARRGGEAGWEKCLCLVERTKGRREEGSILGKIHCSYPLCLHPQRDKCKHMEGID